MRHLTTALMLIVTATTLAGCERYWLDRQMKNLCEKDGGIKIYEKVKLKDGMFDQTGSVKHEYKELNGKYAVLIAGNYWEIEDSSPIKEGDPLKGGSSLTRVHTAIVRADDKKVLAEGVQYLRAGGDLIVIGHHSQASCPNMPLDLAQEVFILE